MIEQSLTTQQASTLIEEIKELKQSKERLEIRKFTSEFSVSEETKA